MMQIIQIFLQFFLLGWVSFGGPAAHIGYFHRQFVEQKRWLDNEAYGRLVALCQFLPGPGSSQLGFALGYRRAGLAGAVAAFCGFTLPSFLLLYALARMPEAWLAEPLAAALLHGLKLLAVVVVADAVLTMSKSFCKSRFYWGLAAISGSALLLLDGVLLQFAILALAGGIAAWHCPLPMAATKPSMIRLHLPALAMFLVALALALLPTQGILHQLYVDFFQAGALVFGGGHVVLPLLQQSVGELLSPERFLTGYAAAQAIPGPMFTLASFLGAEIASEQPLQGALVATFAVFLPGFLLVLMLYSGWEQLAARPRIAAAVSGVNAAVVGLLFSALYQPVFVTAVRSSLDLVLVAVGFYLLKARQWPILAVISTMLGISVMIFVIG